jgi:hypothetical protein
MNRRSAMNLVLGVTLTVNAGWLGAQEGPPPPRPEGMRHGGEAGGDMMAPPMGDRIELLGFEGMHGGKIVTGAPFIGVAVTESTQTLADGNHITRKTQSNLFRDSQGRLRKEVTISGFGPLAASGGPKSFVVINDPVAETNFVLHPETKVAEQMSHARRAMQGPMKGAFKEKWQARQQEEVTSGNLKREDLGTLVISGVGAQGSRLTRTIPAGQIGNEKPILIMHETWYSNDLQMVVMSKRSDPWAGETTYTLTNIQRTEPAPALFAVPSEYTVKASHPFGKPGVRGFKHGPPMVPPADN